MTLEEFKNSIQNKFYPAKVLQNPAGGTSTIIKYTDDKIYYKRSNSTISVKFKDLFEAYLHFKGKVVTSAELENYAPHIFDSYTRPSGYSCNCTLLFLLLSTMNQSGDIFGAGKKGKPFGIKIM